MKDIDAFDILYGMTDCKNLNYLVINHILILFKKYVYKCRADQSNFSLNAFMRTIDSTINLEYYCAQRKGTLGIHLKKWECFK